MIGRVAGTDQGLVSVGVAGIYIRLNCLVTSPADYK